MCRWPMKLIFSMFGVPSATPAQENSASTGPEICSTAASTRLALAEVHLDRGDAGMPQGHSSA